MEYFEFDRFGKTKEIKEIEEESFYFFKKLYLKKLLEKDNIDANIFFINNKEDLKSTECLNAFADKFGKKEHLKPVITIGTESLENKDYNDRRFLFLDSSIWSYYCETDTEISDTIKIIEKNYENQLYNLNIAKEFIEFNSRILKESKLNIAGAHADDVSPFIFHSEKNMQNLAKIELKKINSKLKWRFLLIDDFANETLKVNSNINNIKNKTQYIINILENDFGEISLIENIENNFKGKNCKANINDDEDCDKIIEIDIATDIDCATNKISDRTYDIILLDYLLGEDNSGRREYGDKFIKKIEEKINNKKNDIKKTGLLNRFWIFPISSFSTAMIDKIRERGIGHLYKHWYIPRGADPINTPELFRYNLYRFMNLQISEFSNSRINTEKYSKDYLIDILKDLFKPLKKERVDKIAVEIYPELILIHSKLQQLKKDEKNKSRFAKSVRDNYYESKQEKLWQHILHLFYLLSSHGYLKSPEMWKELNSIKQTVDEVTLLKDKNWYKKTNKYIAELYNKIN